MTMFEQKKLSRAIFRRGVRYKKQYEKGGVYFCAATAYGGMRV